MILRRALLVAGSLLFSSLACADTAAADKPHRPVKYARFQIDGSVWFGIVEAERVRQLSGDLFGEWKKTDKTYLLSDVQLLAPTQPRHVFSMAGNYKSHVGDEKKISKTTTTVTTVTTDPTTNESTTETTTTEETRVGGQVPLKFQTPQPFFKSPSSIISHGENIVIPGHADVVHYEAEMVIVIGQRASGVSKSDALDYVLGVTCGNDVSARKWQRGDVQWWRAKGSDTFGPCGPFVVAGIDYDDLMITLRLNGEVKQQESTSNLIHDVASTVSFISQHITLEPGDLIFTGTPGKTSPINPGDVVEVEIDGVGVLRNSVVAQNVLADANLETLWEEGGFTEGAAAGPDDLIYFSDFGNPFDSRPARVMKFDPRTGETVIHCGDSKMANGLMFDRQGRLIACCASPLGGRRALVEISPNGIVNTIVGQFQGKRFNSPNDLVIDRRGRVWFSDPKYVGPEKMELSSMDVYRYDPDGSLHRVTTDISKPNGVGMSPDGGTLYIAETDNGTAQIERVPDAVMGRMTLNAFPVGDDGTLGRKKVLVDFGKSTGIDGMTIDVSGNIYAAVRSEERYGIVVYSPEGIRRGYLPTPTLPTNCCFGLGSEAQTLYVTAGGGLYCARLQIEGHHPSLAD